MLRNIFWGVIILSISIYLSWIVATCVKDVLKASAAKNWPTSMGTIVSSKVISGCSKSFNPEISYQYKVGNASYVGNRLNFGLIDCGSKSDAQEIASQYPEKMVVTVHYNPELPSEAVIKIDQVTSGTWWFIFTMPFAIIILIFVSWSFMRNVRFTANS
jgi:hypothetical protein